MLVKEVYATGYAALSVSSVVNLTYASASADPDPSLISDDTNTEEFPSSISTLLASTSTPASSL